MKTIMIVEDDANIRDLLVYALNNNGFKAYGYPNAKEFYNQIGNLNPSLVILDIMLDGEDGYDILKKLRSNSQYTNLPIILLTAKDNEYDKVKGLDMGADDYITKPFGVLETISRIKAVLRRMPDQEEVASEISYKGIVLDYKRRKASVDGEELELTYKEFEMLYYFLENVDLVLSRDKLMEQIWGYDYAGESRTVDVHIRTLRQKLADKGYLIKTIRNVGYKLGD